MVRLVARLTLFFQLYMTYIFIVALHWSIRSLFISQLVGVLDLSGKIDETNWKDAYRNYSQLWETITT